MKVRSFGLARFKNLQLLGYCDDIQSLIEKILASDERQFTQEFTNALNQMHLVQSEDKEVFGEQVRLADNRTDKVWSSINTILQVNRDHFVDDIAKAAREVDGVFSTIDNPTAKSYAEEYAALKHLIAKMDELNADVLKLAGIDLWFDELKRRVDEFNALRANQAISKSNINIGASKRARQSLTDAHRDMLDTLNVLLKIKHTEALERFAEAFEQKNNDYRAAKKISDTKDAIDKAKNTHDDADSLDT